MTALRVFLSRLFGSLGWRSRTDHLDADIQAHLDLLASDYERKGMSRQDALLAARRDFGGIARAVETWRDQRRLPAFDILVQDVRYALRTMLWAPTFTGVAVVTLALGIGANTAIFQVLHALVIKPLPVRDPYRLVELQPYHNGREQSFSYPLFRELAARQTVVEGIFVSNSGVPRQPREWRVDGRRPSAPVQARLASGNYFKSLGTDTQLGRVFAMADDQRAAPPVAVISDAFWRREFDARPCTNS